MKHWISDTVPVHIVPGDPVILTRTTMCIGLRFNKIKGYWVHVFNRAMTPLTDDLLQFHVEHHGA